MKKIRALCLILMLVFSALVFSACGESEKIKKAEKIELSQTSITLQVGEIALIDVKISPVDLLNKEFDVIGGNDDVATIDIDLEGMRIVVKAADYIVDGVADTTIGVRTVDGSYKEEHLNIHVYQDDPSVEMPKNFTFDGRNLVWQTVDDAIGYTVDINGESRVVYTTTFALDLENMAGQTIVAKVKANGASQNLDSPYTSELKFTVLNKPTNVKYNDATQILSWDEVENATSYAVFVNNRLIYCEETQLEILDEIPANFECKLKVRANGNTSKTYINSSFSDVITLKKLGSPLNLTIENRKVTWSTIGGAIAYDVLCSYKKNGEDVEDIVRVRNTTYTLPFDIDAGVGEVKVRAIGDGKSSMTSDYTLVKKFTKLSSVRNLRVEDGIIYWDSVEFATNYTIILENVIDDEGNTETISYSQTGSSSILSYNIEKYQAGSYQVNIQANGSVDSISSNPLSRPLVVTKLAVPTGLQATKVDGVCKIKWQNDPKATGYVIYLKNSSTISYNIAKVEGSYVEYSFNGSVMEVGENLISVKALGSLSNSDITYVNSDISDDIAVTKLSVPNINMSKIKSGIVSWSGIKNVGSYELIVKDFNGTVLHTYRLATISIDFNSEEYKLAVGNYQITLRALASQNAEAYGNDDYMAVFDGEVSSTIKICKLPTNYVKVENGTVNDLTPQGNYLYNYLVTFEDGQTSTYASAHEYVENVIRGGERVSIQVQAVSIKEKDETNMYFISSDLSQKLYVRKLPVINDISMENGVIKYGVALENYSGYQFNLVLNETTNILNGTNTLYDFSKVEAGIYSVKIKAISTQSGNGLSQDVNNPLNINGKLGSAFPFEKLAAPDDLQVSSFGSSEYESFRNIMQEIKTYNPLSSGSLVWSEVSKATAYELIFDDDIDSQRKTMTVLDTYESLQNTDITTNIRHSVLIKSLGNGSNIIDSEKSTSYVSFTKFASPDNISLRNGVLTWTYSDNSKNPNKIVDINNPYLKLAIFLIVDTNGNCYSTLSKMVDGKYVKLDIATLTLSELQDALQMNSCPIPTELVQATSLSVIAVPMNIYIKNELLHFDFVEDISKCVISDFTDGINVEPLATPFDLKMENNVISWSPIRSNEALNEYRLFINYGNGSNNYISFKQGTPMVDYTNRVVFVDDIKSAENCTWRFNKQNFELMFGEGEYKAGNYQFKIQAIANNVYYEMNGEYIYYINSDISTAKSIILLANPDIVLNNGRIVWRKAPNVLGYWIFVNTTSHGEDYMELTNSDVNPVDSDLNGYCQLPFGEYYAAGTYYFNAVAIGDGTNTVSSEFSYDSEKEYTKLEKITGLRIENGLITFDEHQIVKDNSDCYYNVYYDQKYHEIRTTSTFPAELEGGKQHTITVFARGDNAQYISSDETGPCTIDNYGTLPTKLEAPTEMNIVDGKLYWNRIEGTTNYKIIISAGIENIQVDDTTIDTTYDLTHLPGGSYRIVLQAVGSNAYINSDKSTKDVKKLADIADLKMTDGYIMWKFSQDSAGKATIVVGKDQQGKDITREITAYTYRVIVNNEEEIRLTELNSDVVEEYNGASLIGKYIRFNLSGYVAGVYALNIYNFGGANSISSSLTPTFEFEKLPSPERIAVKDDSLIFTNIENATNYIVNMTIHQSANDAGSTYSYLPESSAYSLVDGYRTINFNSIRLEAINKLRIVDSNIDHYSLSVIAIGSTFGMLSNESGDDYYVTSDVSRTIQITQSPTPIMSYETYDFTKNDGTVEQRFAGRIHWNFANSTQTSNINFYKVFVKASNSQNSVLFGYDISEAQVDPNYPDYNFYIVRDRRFANVTYIDTYEFFVIACQDENGFDSAPSLSLADLSYNLFASGQNGSTIPFQITTELHYSAMKYNLDASYVLTKNMTLTSVPESIGTTDMPFLGTFDGAGYTISGTNGALVINSRNTTFKGLFGVIGEGGIVKNVTFNATINATTGRTENLIQIAAIAITNNGRIEDVVVQGTVSSEYNLEAAKVYNAGVAVYNYGTITRVASKAIINPKNTRNDVYAGGISIFNYGTIEKSGFVGQAYGQVVGGITAQNLGGKIEQCYYEENAALSTAIITSNKGLSINMAGGIAGYMTSGSISYCYSTARVSGSTNTIPVYIGGMVGYISGGKIQKSYVVAVNPSGASIITATGSTLNATKAGVFVGVSDSTTPVSGSGLICRRAYGQAFIGSGTFSAQEVASIQSSLDNADLNDHGYFDTSTTNPSLRNAKY